MGFAKGSTHPARSSAQRGGSRRMTKDFSLWTRTFIDMDHNILHYDCIRAHQGAFLETILKRSRNAVPAGPGRNRALGRLLGSAGTIIRSFRGVRVVGPGGRPLLRGSRKLFGAHKAAWSVERRAVSFGTRVRVESAD